MTIDVHAHIVDRRYLDELSATLGLEMQRTDDGKTLFRHGGSTVAWLRADMFDVNARLADMDAKRIDLRVLSLSTPNVYLWDRLQQIAMARHVNDALARIGAGERGTGRFGDHPRRGLVEDIPELEPIETTARALAFEWDEEDVPSETAENERKAG